MDNRKGENNYNNYYNQNQNYNNSVNNYNQNNNYNYHNTQNQQNNNVDNFRYNNFSNNYNNNSYNYPNNQNYNNNQNYGNSYNSNYNNNQNYVSNYNSNYNNINSNYNGYNSNQYPNNNNGQYQNNSYNYSNQGNQYYNNYNSYGNGYNNYNPNYNNYYGNMQNNYYPGSNYNSRLNENKSVKKNNRLQNIIDYFSKLNLKKIFMIIIVVFVLTVIIKVTFNLVKSYDVKIYLNGASIVEEEVTKCKSDYLGHCYLTLPMAKRYDGEVLGYSRELDSKDAEYQVGQKIEIEEDLSLYVISKKEKKLKIDTSDIDDLSASEEELTCSTYNTENVCSINVPQFNKRGYENIGYSSSKESKKINFIPGDTYNGNNALYPVYKKLPTNKVYSVKSSFALSDGYVDVESNCDNKVASLFTDYIKAIDKYWPFLFHGQKIVFFGESTFHSYTNSSYGVGGVTYPESTYPELAPLIVKCTMPSVETYDVYLVIVHELAHSFDMQYQYKNKKDNNIDKRIAFEDDITEVYNKYKDLKTNRPLSNYAFSGNGNRYYDTRIEFFAELMAFYYLNFVDTNYKVIQGKNFYRGNYPADMKKVAEKYICIGMNNFDKTKCN